MFDLPCIILCGGKSSRMGEDKALLPFSNFNSLSQYQYTRLKPYFKNIYLSSKINKFDFLNDDKIICDKSEIYSPLIALNSIFEYLRNEEKIFIISVDTPLVKIESIKKLVDKSKNFDICVAQTEKIHNLCGVFSSNIKNEIENMLENNIHKIGFLLKNTNFTSIIFQNEEEFINLNNKFEYEKALTIIKNSYDKD